MIVIIGRRETVVEPVSSTERSGGKGVKVVSVDFVDVARLGTVAMSESAVAERDGRAWRSAVEAVASPVLNDDLTLVLKGKSISTLFT